MRLLHLHHVSLTVVVLVLRVDQVTLRAILQDPALARRLGRRGLRVVDREARHELLADGGVTIEVHLAAETFEARLVEHSRLLLGAQRVEGVLLNRDASARNRHGDRLAVQF